MLTAHYSDMDELKTKRLGFKVLFCLELSSSVFQHYKPSEKPSRCNPSRVRIQQMVFDGFKPVTQWPSPLTLRPVAAPIPFSSHHPTAACGEPGNLCTGGRLDTRPNEKGPSGKT